MVSTQDRVMSGLLFGAPPFAIAIVAAALGAKTVAKVFVGLSVAGGVIGAVGTPLYQTGTSPLAKRGWTDGYPGLVEDVNAELRKSGGYEYDPKAFEESTASIVSGGQKSYAYVEDKLQTPKFDSRPLSGVGGFWALR